jgi:hypothetical protein
LKKWPALLLIVALCAFTSLVGMRPLTAHAATSQHTKVLKPFTTVAPNAYAHSWYITNPDIPNNYQAMYNLGHSDGQFDSATCTLSQIVLDFGQVDYGTGYWGGGSGYGVYVYNAALHYPFITDAQVLSAAERYVQGWYDGSSSCPRLRIIIGTNNAHECPLGAGCTTYNAGTAWGQTVKSLNSYVSSHGETGKVVDVDGGDDIETDVPRGWDTYSKTLGFVQGFNNGDNTAIFMDYGDVFTNSYWSDADLYNIAWGYGNDSPIPEIYGSGLLDSWAQFHTNHPDVFFYGVMTECSSIQGSYCGSPAGEYTPSSAYNAFVGRIGTSKVGAFATNILYQ